MAAIPATSSHRRMIAPPWTCPAVLASSMPIHRVRTEVVREGGRDSTPGTLRGRLASLRRQRRPARNLDRFSQRRTDGSRLVLTSQGPAQLHEGDTAEERRDPEGNRVVDQNRRGGDCQRLVIQDEGADQPAVDAADPSWEGNVPAQLPDQVAEHQHAEGGGVAEGIE